MSPCPKSPEKLRFATQSAAVRKADEKSVAHGVHYRAYFCDRQAGGCDWYHLTTKPRTILEKEETDG